MDMDVLELLQFKQLAGNDASTREQKLGFRECGEMSVEGFVSKVVNQQLLHVGRVLAQFV
ncbi:hypothetical protein D3C77_445800 [compost metagenome]